MIKFRWMEQNVNCIRLIEPLQLEFARPNGKLLSTRIKSIKFLDIRDKNCTGPVLRFFLALVAPLNEKHWKTNKIRYSNRVIVRRQIRLNEILP